MLTESSVPATCERNQRRRLLAMCSPLQDMVRSLLCTDMEINEKRWRVVFLNIRVVMDFVEQRGPTEACEWLIISCGLLLPVVVV